MALRISLVGVFTGAVLGGVGRAAVAVIHLSEPAQGIAAVVLSAATVGILIGALAGATGAPLLGAVVGAALTAVVYLATLPIVLFFHFLGTLTAPPLVEVIAVGALAGGIGGAADRMAARRRSSGSGRDVT